MKNESTNPNPEGNADRVYREHRNHDANDSWAAIRNTVGSVHLPEGWQRHYAARSLTVTNRTRSFVIKVTVNMDVYVDRRIKGSVEFKSDRYEYKSNKEMTDHAMLILTAAMPVSIPVEA